MAMFEILHPREYPTTGQGINGKNHIILLVKYFWEDDGFPWDTELMTSFHGGGHTLQPHVHSQENNADLYRPNRQQYSGIQFLQDNLVSYYPRGGDHDQFYNGLKGDGSGEITWWGHPYFQNQLIFLIFEWNVGFSDASFTTTGAQNNMTVSDGTDFYITMSYQDGAGNFTGSGSGDWWDTGGTQSQPYQFRRVLDAHPGYSAGNAYTHAKPIPDYYFSPELAIITHDMPYWDTQSLGIYGTSHDIETTTGYLKTELLPQVNSLDGSMGYNIGLVYDQNQDGEIDEQDGILSISGRIAMYTNIPPNLITLSTPDFDEQVQFLTGSVTGQTEEGSFGSTDDQVVPFIGNMYSEGFVSWGNHNDSWSLQTNSVYQLNPGFTLTWDSDIEVVQSTSYYGTMGEEVVLDTTDYTFSGGGQPQLTDNSYYKCYRDFTIEMSDDALGLQFTEYFSLKVTADLKHGVIAGGTQVDWVNIDNEDAVIPQTYVNFDNSPLHAIGVLGSTLDNIPIPEGYSEIMIERPSDIILHLLTEELGYSNPINSNELQIAREEHNSSKYAFTIDAKTINDRVKARDLIEEFAASTQLMPKLTNDVLGFNVIRKTYTGTEENALIPTRDIIRFKFKRTPIENLKTSVNVKYKVDYGSGETTEETGNLNIEDLISTWDGEFYGLEYNEDGTINHDLTRLEFESMYIRDLDTAQSLAQFLLLWYCNVHTIINIDLPLTYLHLETGDLIRFEEVINGMKAYGLDYTQIDQINSQITFPLFLITSVNKSLDKVTLEAIQLHHTDITENYAWVGFEPENIDQYPRPDIISIWDFIDADPIDPDPGVINPYPPRRRKPYTPDSNNASILGERLGDGRGGDATWSQKLIGQINTLEDRREYVEQYGADILKVPDNELYLWEQHFSHHSTEHIKNMLKHRVNGNDFEKSHNLAMEQGM